MHRMKLLPAAVATAVVLSAAPVSASADGQTRVVAIVDEGVVFDRTVAAVVDTDAALNVLMAAQDAARNAGALELDIATGTTAEAGLVEINVTTHGTNVQTGENTTDTVQTGSAQSGDAIDGQVVSVAGSASVQQSNVSVNTHTQTGTTSGNNSG